MLWSSIESLSLALVSFAMLAMLARYLDASTFGKAAIALGIVQIACSLAESFFHDAVVQRGDLHQSDIDAAHTVSVLIGIVLAAAIAVNAALGALAGPSSVGAVGQGADVAWLALWMAPSIVLTGWCAMSIASMRRKLATRELALATAGSRFAAGVLGLLLLSRGFGVWALVAQQNLSALLLFVLLRSVRAPAPRLTTNLSGARRLASFAAVNSVHGMLTANMSRIFQLLCGLVMPASLVGQVSLALRLVDMLVSVMVTGVARVTMPRLSAALHVGRGVSEGFLSATRNFCIVTMPVLVLMAALAHPLVQLVGHDGWSEAAVLVMWFALAQALRSPTFLSNTLLASLGKPHVNLCVVVVELATLALLTWLLRDPLVWVARLALVLPLVIYVMQRYAGIGPWQLLRSVRESLFAAIAMGAALAWGIPSLGWDRLPPILAVLAAGLAGTLIYAALASLLLMRRPTSTGQTP
jgi:O-antigen/teichoic acid export membrane protein